MADATPIGRTSLAQRWSVELTAQHARTSRFSSLHRGRIWHVTWGSQWQIGGIASERSRPDGTSARGQNLLPLEEPDIVLPSYPVMHILSSATVRGPVGATVARALEPTFRDPPIWKVSNACIDEYLRGVGPLSVSATTCRSNIRSRLMSRSYLLWDRRGQWFAQFPEY